MAGCAPQILEKSLHALTLLGHLQEAGLPLTFRGGTSLLLHLPEIHRLSIDIDIVCPVEGADLERILAEVSAKSPFTGWEESLRDGTRLPKRRHFKFFYPSALGIQEYAPPNVMLDVVAESEVVHVLESKPITTGFLTAEREVKVQLPTLESLLADKLTAFAPTTTGVPLRKTDGTPGDVVQVVKQLFDVGMLFGSAANGAEVVETYKRAQAIESGYRETRPTFELTLDDTIAACLAAMPFKAKVRAKFDDYPLLKKGYTGMRGHLTRPFSEEDFRRFAAQTATVAAHIKTGTPLDFATLQYTGSAEQIAAIKANSFNNTEVDWLDGLKQINPAAYHYWMVTQRLRNSATGR
jgi:Nucleotidyl transferase AbiEii toxin, Type IV TA system